MSHSLAQKCRGCAEPAECLAPVLAMDPMPLAGMFCDTPEESASAPVFPLTWVHCARCGLVQVQEDVPEEILFSKYNYSSSSVAGLVRHFMGYAEFLAGRYANSDSDVTFLEIGCNDGVLLTKLPRKWKLIGCDPSDVAARAAVEHDSYDFFAQPFSLQNVRNNDLAGTVDVISGSNCLAHISDLKDVFEGAWLALRDGGHFWIEVHDLDALLKGFQWDTIYHEHKVEWSEDSLKRCLGAVGFQHLETIRTPMHGGALRICFKKSATRTAPNETIIADTRLRVLSEAYRRRYETPAARALLAAQTAGQRIAAYGAAGRANVYLNQLPQLRFDYIVDEAPLRVNKFIPRTGTPIVPPQWLSDKPAESCLVTAWNYRDDIVRKNPQHRGAWLTAFEEF